MNARSMENLKDKLCQLLEEIEKKGSITTAELEHIFKITSSIKNIDKVIMADRFDSSYDDGLYNDTMSGRRYSRGVSYNGGMYSGNQYGNENSFRRGYSYGDETASMRDRLETMMNSGNMNSNDKAVLREALSILNK